MTNRMGKQRAIDDGDETTAAMDQVAQKSAQGKTKLVLHAQLVAQVKRQRFVLSRGTILDYGRACTQSIVQKQSRFGLSRSASWA